MLEEILYIPINKPKNVKYIKIPLREFILLNDEQVEVLIREKIEEIV